MTVLPKWLKKVYTLSPRLNNKRLNYIEKHTGKYFGVILCNDLCDDSDIKQQIRPTYARGNILISKFRKCD